VEKFVAVVICVVFGLPTSAFATADGTLLRSASHLSGLTARRPVPTATLSGRHFDAVLVRALNRDYPRALQRRDMRLYTLLGLTAPSVRARSATSPAWYDAAARRLVLKRKPMPSRTHVVHELVRALIDQNFGLGRLKGLRSRDRDRAVAANGIVDGTAALASRRRPDRLHGSPLDRFLHLEREAGLGPGRALAAELRYLGRRSALATALRTFPQTTEQLLHIDKFLERERAKKVTLPGLIGSARLSTSETFGELHVRNLLRAFSVPRAATAAAGWGGGRLALYRTREGHDVAVLLLRWDTAEDAAEWRDAVPPYAAAAFPGATAHDCPPLDRCWSSTTELAAGVLGDRSVLVTGPGAETVATALIRG
jgi:hypothetical protein